MYDTSETFGEKASKDKEIKAHSLLLRLTMRKERTYLSTIVNDIGVFQPQCLPGLIPDKMLSNSFACNACMAKNGDGRMCLASWQRARKKGPCGQIFLTLVERDDFFFPYGESPQ
jgi:hypothetical protein